MHTVTNDLVDTMPFRFLVGLGFASCNRSFSKPLYPLRKIMSPVTIMISHYLVYSFNVKTAAVSDTDLYHLFMHHHAKMSILKYDAWYNNFISPDGHSPMKITTTILESPILN